MEREVIASVHRELVEWGILDPGTPTLTRRFRGALMRAASRLQAEERAGHRRPGHAIANAVDEALREYPLPPGAVASAEHRTVVVAIEVASLPPAVRGFLGV